MRAQIDLVMDITLSAVRQINEHLHETIRIDVTVKSKCIVIPRRRRYTVNSNKRVHVGTANQPRGRQLQVICRQSNQRGITEYLAEAVASRSEYAHRALRSGRARVIKVAAQRLEWPLRPL